MTSARNVLIGAATVLCAQALTLGCGDPLEPSQTIERTRVLGARVDVEGEPERASPAPGESATVRWLVAEPRAKKPMSWALAACPMAAVQNGPAECASAPFAAATGDETDLEPALTFTVPDQSAFESEPTIAVLGAFCVEGDVLYDRAGVPITCSPVTDDSTIAGFEVPLQLDGFVNENPSFANSGLTLGGRRWNASPPAAGVQAPPGSPCSAPDVAPLEVHGTDAVNVELTFADDPREPLPEGESLVGDLRETLQVSHFSTHGELERAQTFVEATDEAVPVRVRVAWEPPRSAPARGELVRFYFVLRDSRGGADWAVREVCVLP